MFLKLKGSRLNIVAAAVLLFCLLLPPGAARADGPEPPTGLVAIDPDATFAGVDGSDFQVSWTPSISASVYRQEIYILPLGTVLNLPTHTPAAAFDDNTTHQWTGNSSLTLDSANPRAPLAEGDYTIYVAARDASGSNYGSTTMTAVSHEPGNFTYSLSGGEATITGYTGTDMNVVIPESINDGGINYRVTAIDISVFYGLLITSVVIPTGVQVIPLNEFAMCTSLNSVVFSQPSSLTGIDLAAFNGCTSLTELNIPDGITSVGNKAFLDCSGLSRVYFWGDMPAFGTQVFDGAAPDLIIYYHVSQAPSWSGFSAYTARAFCNLTLDLQDGSAPVSSNVEVDSSGHITAPADPSSPAGSFGGWYKDPACTDDFVFATDTVSDDITLYAKWVPAASEPTISLTTTKTAGASIYLSIEADPADLSGAWVDLNGNNIKDAGEDVVGLNKRYTVSSPTITIHGKVTGINCQLCQLTGLDLSNNSHLVNLTCSNNQLTSLDLSQNTSLQSLTCRNNQLASLDVTHNTVLKSLDAYYNELASLDVSHNTLLASLNCQNNRLASLDVSQNTALTYLNCSSNHLTSLDLTNNTLITKLLCASNQLAALDVAHCPAMTWLTCSGNAIGVLNLSHNTVLTDLYCNYNQLAALDLSANTLLTRVDCYNNQLTTLNLPQDTVLYWLDCSDNRLASLDISKNRGLKVLKIFSNSIKGSEMTEIAAGLPARTAADGAKLYVIDTIAVPTDGNIALKSDVVSAAGKNWTVYDWHNGYEQVYPGSDPAASGEAVTFVLSNEQGHLIDQLIAAGHGGKNLYQVMQLLQPQSGGVITDEFLQTLSSCPADSEVFNPGSSLSNFAGLNNPVGINSDGTLMILSIYGKDYVGHPGYPTEKGYSAEAGEMWFTHAQDQGFYIDTGHAVAGAGSGNYKAFAIAWQPYLVPTFVLSNEEGGLIDHLIAAGYGDDSLYEVLQVLKPLSGGAITDEFMAQLAACPAGCDAKTAALNNFADVSNNPIGIGANGELIVSACYGRDFYGDAGYTTHPGHHNAAGYMLFTSADSGSYYIDLGCMSDGSGSTIYYKGFAIAWAPAAIEGTTLVLSNEEGREIDWYLNSGYAGYNLYEFLVRIQEYSNGVITDQFLATLAACPTNRAIFTTRLNDYRGQTRSICINSDGTVNLLDILGRDYYGKTGYTTCWDNRTNSGAFTYTTDPAYYIDAGTNGSGKSYQAFAIYWAPILETKEADSFVLTNEAGGLVDRLIADGYGSINLYQTLELLKPDSGGIITDEFMAALAAYPNNDDIFREPLSTFAVNYPVCINSDGTVAIQPIYGRDYYQKTGYANYPDSSIAATLFTYPTSTEYYINAGSGYGKGIIVNYKAFGIAWSPAIKAAGSATDSSVTMAGGNQEVSGLDSTWEITVTSGTLKGSTGDDLSSELIINGLPAGLNWTARNAGGNQILITVAGTASPAVLVQTTVTVVIKGSAVQEVGAFASDPISLYVNPAAALAAPVITPNGGSYTTSQNVTITGSGGTIYYTTDGSDPRTSGTKIKYTGAFTINQTTTVRAAVNNAAEWSPVSSAVFTITANHGGDGGGGGSGADDPWIYHENVSLPGETGVKTPAAEPGDLAGHWAHDCIMALIQHGLLKGYPDGTIRPEQEITRGEAAVLLANLLGLQDYQPKSMTSPYSDELPEWARRAILILTEKGIMKGYPDGTFGADQPIIRAEFCAALMQCFPDLKCEGEAPIFADEDSIPDWALPFIKAAACNHLVGGYPDHTFRPQGWITRGEAFAIICVLKGYHREHASR